MNALNKLMLASVFALTAQTAAAAVVTYTYEMNVDLTLDGDDFTGAVVITGDGDTDDIFNVDSTRIANAFDGTISFNGNTYSFTEEVYATRAGGTLAFTADISGLNIGTVVSGNLVPITYGLDEDESFTLTPALTFGSFDTDGGLLTINAFAPGSVTTFTSDVEDASTAPVPLPAGLPLMLAGLGVMGVLRHRKT